MASKFASKIPLYNALTPKRRQQVNMLLGGVAVLAIVLIVSGLIEGPPKINAAGGKELPKPRPLSGVPGAQLEARDAWMGDAGKQLAAMKDELRGKDAEIKRLQDEQRRDRDTTLGQFNELRQRLQMAPVARDSAAPGGATGAPGSTGAPGNTGAPSTSGAPSAPAVAATGTPASGAPAAAPAVATAGRPVNAAEVFPSQVRGDRLPAPNGVYPPGTPNTAGARPGLQGPAGATAPIEPSPVGSLMRVSLTTAAAAASSPTGTSPVASSASPVADQAGGKQAAPKNLSNFLPVGFAKAVLLGGLAAPTGGQAQANPIPVLLRLVDLAVLPNGFRGQVRDCLVIGEGFGDHSAERAYVRTTLLSCVMRDGRVLEVPLKGNVFGEDGMNGLMGKLVTKQGAILNNALLAGVAAGIGQGIAQASQNVTSTALGQVQSAPVDTVGILRGGFGTGVGKALDRLAQYYINLAEKTFPVIEVQSGRQVDVVITQGVSLDVALDGIGAGPGSAPAHNRGESRAPLLQTLQTSRASVAADDDE